MSHISSLTTRIKSLDALKLACEDMGFTFVDGQKTFAWFGRWMNDWRDERSAVAQGFDPATFGKCAHAIRVPGTSYEIGVVPTADGDWVLHMDEYGPGRVLVEKAGQSGTKLAQAYAVRATEASMARLRGTGIRLVGQVGVPGETIRLTYQVGT